MSTQATFFYAHPEDIEGAGVTLREDEAHHVSRVLRLKPGAEIQVVDGIGGWYRVSLEIVDARGARGRILERRMGVGEASVYLHLVVGGMKSRSRFDLVVEKATELGASRITIVNTARSEVARVDPGRSSRVMRAAMKQCMRSRMPILEGPVPLPGFLTTVRSTRRIVCDSGDASLPLRDLVEARDRDVVVIVGPEAGMTEAEIHHCTAAGFQSAILGARRLRTETACISACSNIMMICDNVL